MIMRKLLAGPRSSRFVYLCFRWAGAVLSVLPRRVVFTLLMICDVVRLPGRRRLCQAYFPYVTSHLVVHPAYRFSSRWSGRFKDHTVRVLNGLGANRELAGLISPADLPLLSAAARHALVRSLFELG